MRNLWLAGCLLCGFWVESRADSDVAPPPICDGRYAAAAEMVDAAWGKYGTLYSGGDHAHRLDDVGATVDLYRLWRGLPDLSLRELQADWSSSDELTSQWVWSDDAQHARGLREALALGSRADWLGVSRSELRAHVVRLDLATAVASPADWWRGNVDPALLSERSRELMAQAGESEFLDWLQFAATASEAPAAYGEHHLPDRNQQKLDPAFDRLARLASSKFNAGDGVEWGVVAASLGLSEPGIIALASDLYRKVAACDATGVEFAALASLAPVPGAWHMDQWGDPSFGLVLPKSIRRLVLMRSTWESTAKAIATGTRSFDQATVNGFGPRSIAGRYGLDEMAPWLAVSWSYLAADEATLIAAHKGLIWAPKSVRAFNLMSTAGLLAFARSDGVSDSQRASLIRVAFARAFALGQLELAKSMLPDIRRAFADRAAEIVVVEALHMRWEAKLAVIAATLPGVSTGLHPDTTTEWDGDVQLSYRHGGEYLDIPRELALGVAVQADAESWWQIPNTWSRYRGMHGYTFAQIDRSVVRRASRYLPASGVRAPSLFGQSDDHYVARGQPSGAGIAQWAAWEETSALIGSKRLSNRLADVLVDCADHPGRRWFRRDDCRSESVAKALHRFIQIKRGLGKSDQGVPNGKRAFESLHRNFPKSEWTQRSKYWYQ